MPEIFDGRKSYTPKIVSDAGDPLFGTVYWMKYGYPANITFKIRLFLIGPSLNKPKILIFGDYIRNY